MQGRVIDGPWEGREYKADGNWFRIAIMPGLPAIYDFDPEAMIAPVNIIQGLYRWSFPLRGWVFLWDSLPKKKGGATPH